jgi:hypothetical protein
LHLLGQVPTWVTPPTLFWLLLVTLCPGWLGLWFSCFLLHAIAGMTGIHHHTQLFSTEMGSPGLFFPRQALNHDPPNLTSQVARITGVSHWHWVRKWFLMPMKTWLETNLVHSIQAFMGEGNVWVSGQRLQIAPFSLETKCT